MTPWLVVLTEPQQEIPIVWRLHLLGLEMFTPVIRRRIRTGGRLRHGHPVTRLVARPMFPSYGFVRKVEIENSDQLTQVRGVRDVLRASNHTPVTLPHEAVLAIFAKQQEIQGDFLLSQRRGRFLSQFHTGDRVRVDDDGIYSGLVATVDRIDGKGRVEVLFGMIRHTLPEQHGGGGMSEFKVGATFNIETPERFPQLSALAERLGVKPNEGDSGFFLCMKDGTRYDAFALINAVLDRLDERR